MLHGSFNPDVSPVNEQMQPEPDQTKFNGCGSTTGAARADAAQHIFRDDLDGISLGLNYNNMAQWDTTGLTVGGVEPRGETPSERA